MDISKIEKRFIRWMKPRFVINYCLGIYALFYAYASDGSIVRGLWIVIIGLLVRSWANGYAIKTEKLTTSGPYAYIRNPLYVGSFLIMAGLLIVLQLPTAVLVLSLSVFIWIVFIDTVNKEEQLLTDRFNKTYRDYKSKVSAFFPRLSPYTKGEKWGWSLKRYLVSQEYKILIWITVAIIFFHLKNEILIENETLSVKNITLIFVSLFLAMSDAVGEFFRKNNWAVFDRVDN